MIDPRIRLIDLTAGQFLELIEEATQQQKVVVNPENPAKPYVYGLAGIMELFGCSKNTASRIKRSGQIDAAITQIGGLIITDAKKALELRNLANSKKKNK